ncbi:hypothetical protein ABC255_25780 [Neobacillus sp. 3P2-tot-E-2]|uniref:hypothetical protein n=1 Tax=Neobacillus sp. 3P2-tot-E-2 TaxID=3132212 RepID=UPI00399F5A53
MTKKRTIFGVIVLLFFIISWFSYQKITDDTYKGMSIIPEEHKDIPLFKGLEPTEHQYIMKGNHWEEIYHFYKKELPGLGWQKDYIESALDDHEADNDGSRFMSRWRKEDFAGELWISAHYNQNEDQTEVMFDQTEILQSTTWIEDVPDSICIYQSPTAQNCTEITDKSKIEQITRFINEAMDTKEEVDSRNETMIIDFTDIKVNVFYEDEKEFFLQSEKGTKLMKPEQEFLELLIIK